MAYIHAAVLPIPTKNKDAYMTMAKKMAQAFKAQGALSVSESWGDMVPPGEKTSFPLSVQLKDDETVVISWIVWPSKEAADKGMQAMRAQPKSAEDMPTHLFDGSRTIFGAFEQIVSE